MGIANCYAQYRDEYTWLKMQLAIPSETRVREAGISNAEEAKKKKKNTALPRRKPSADSLRIPYDNSFMVVILYGHDNVGDDEGNSDNDS